MNDGLFSSRDPKIHHPSADIFRAQRDLLESLLPDGWFAVPRRSVRPDLRHPALNRWEILNTHVESDGRLNVDDRDDSGLCLLSETLLDGAMVMRALGGRIHDLRIGALANYGDARVQNRIRRVTPDPGGFLSVMTEMSRASLHVGGGHQVEASEDDGVADLLARVPGLDLPVVVECKRVGATSTAHRCSKVVSYANGQIKRRAGGRPCCGVVCLDITDRARLFVRHLRSQPRYRQHYPPVLDVVEQAVKGMLRCSNSAVSAVVLVWSEIRMQPEGNGSSRLSVKKRTRVLCHRRPAHVAPDDLVLFLERPAGDFNLRMRPSPIEPGRGLHLSLVDED